MKRVEGTKRREWEDRHDMLCLYMKFRKPKKLKGEARKCIGLRKHNIRVNVNKAMVYIYEDALIRSINLYTKRKRK